MSQTLTDHRRPRPLGCVILGFAGPEMLTAPSCSRLNVSLTQASPCLSHRDSGPGRGAMTLGRPHPFCNITSVRDTPIHTVR